jgi:multiple sugar transport system substrate-binding protein
LPIRRNADVSAGKFHANAEAITLRLIFRSYSIMKRQKTLLLLMSLFAMFVLALPTAAQEDVTLGFVYGSFAPQERWEAYFSDLLTEHPNIHINYIPVSLDDGWAGYTDKIVTLLAGGEQVDIIWTAIEGVPMLAEKGVLSPLDADMSGNADFQEYIDDVDPALLDGLKWEGQQYLLPFAWNNMVIWYNPTLFAEAGLDAPAEGWTWDDFLTAARALTQDLDGDGQTDRYGFNASAGWFTGTPWFITNGTSVLQPDLSGPNLDDPKVAETLQWIHDLVWVEKVSPQGPDFPNDEFFAAGNLAMFGAGRWPLESLKPMGVTDFEIAPWPQNVQSGTVFGTDGYGITTMSQHRAEAWLLVSQLLSTDVMSSLVDVSAASGSIPARRSLALGESMAAQTPANYAFWYDSLAYAAPVANPPNYPDLDRIYNRYVSLIMADEMSVEEAVGHMQEEMQASFDAAS